MLYSKDKRGPLEIDKLIYFCLGRKTYLIDAKTETGMCWFGAKILNRAGGFELEKLKGNSVSAVGNGKFTEDHFGIVIVDKRFWKAYKWVQINY